MLQKMRVWWGIVGMEGEILTDGVRSVLGVSMVREVLEVKLEEKETLEVKEIVEVMVEL